MTNDLVLEARDKAAAAQGQGVVLSLAALKSDTIHKALEIDIGDIAILSSALTGQLTGIALLHTLQLCIHGGLVHSVNGLLHGQAGVCADLHLRLHGDLNGQGDTLGLAGSVHRNLRTAHRLHAGFLHSLLKSSREQLVDGVIGKNIGTVHLLDQRTGGLALAEAGHSVLLALFLEYSSDSRLKSLCVDGKLQLCHAFLELLTLDEIHFNFPPLKEFYPPWESDFPRRPRTASLPVCEMRGRARSDQVQQSRQSLL